jgi:hypothetical protein
VPAGGSDKQAQVLAPNQPPLQSFPGTLVIAFGEHHPRVMKYSVQWEPL